MSLLLDTGIFLGAFNGGDTHHQHALAVWKAAISGKHGRILSIDPVYIEAMNFMARKPRSRASADMLRQLRHDPKSPVQWISMEPPDLAAATSLYFEHFAQRLAMTDCLLAVACARSGAPVATLDEDLAAFLGKSAFFA